MKVLFWLCFRPRIGKLVAEWDDSKEIIFVNDDFGNHSLDHVDAVVSIVDSKCSIKFRDYTEIFISVSAKLFCRENLMLIKTQIKNFIFEHKEFFLDKRTLSVELIA